MSDAVAFRRNALQLPSASSFFFVSIRVHFVVVPRLAVALREGGSLFLYGNSETKFREIFRILTTDVADDTDWGRVAVANANSEKTKFLDKMNRMERTG